MTPWYADRSGRSRTISAARGLVDLPGNVRGTHRRADRDRGHRVSTPRVGIGLPSVSIFGATCLGSACGSGTPTDPVGHGTRVYEIVGRGHERRRSESPASHRVTDHPRAGLSRRRDRRPRSPSTPTWPTESRGQPRTAPGRLTSASATVFSHKESKAVDLAMNSYHAVVLASAGNSGERDAHLCGCEPRSGRSRRYGQERPTFSNYGSPDVFVSAPGVLILSTWPAAIDGDCPYVEPSGYCHLDGRGRRRPMSPGSRRGS